MYVCMYHIYTDFTYIYIRLTSILKKKVIKISQSDGIFSKLKKIFTRSTSSSTTSNNTISNTNDNLDEFFINSSNQEPLLDNLTISNTTLSNSDIEDDLSTTIDNFDEFSISSSNQEPLLDNIDLNVKGANFNKIHENISIQSSENIYFSKLDTKVNTYSTTVRRKILFKVEKYKFDYPVPKSTTLYYYPNLPIIQSLEFTTQIKHDNTQTTTIVCNNQSVIVPIEFDYEEIKFKPYISFSVALYNQKPPTIFDPSKSDFDINNLDIYTLENDALFSAPFTMCFPVDSKNFVPSDFIIDVAITDPLGGAVSPIYDFDSYYLYEVEVEIEIKLSPAIDLSSINLDTLNVLNTQLNKAQNNTLFTQGELNYITSIDYTGLTSLDYTIFAYLLNLKILNISNTNAKINASVNFAHLNNLVNLTTLIAKNNKFVDYSAFSLLTNLVNTLTSIDIQNDNTRFFTILTTFGDITPLAMFKNLTSLNIANNNISTLPADFGELSKLNTLDLSGNTLTSLPPEIRNLYNLTSINLSGNSIEDLSSLYELNNLEYLNIEGNPIDPFTVENLPATKLDFSNSNLDNKSIINLKVSDKLQTLIISRNQISDLSPLEKYPINVLALNQTVYYNLPQIQLDGLFTIELEEFLKDLYGEVPCIDYISDKGVCGPIESCDCLSISWSDITEATEVYFDFSDITDTFTGRVFITLDAGLIL